MVTAIVLGVATAVAYGLLAIEYAVFTTAITVFVVVLTDTLGTPAFEAAGERAVGHRRRDRDRRARVRRLRRVGRAGRRPSGLTARRT